MSVSSVDRSPRRRGGGQLGTPRAVGSEPTLPARVQSRTQSRTELAVEKLVGLVALATGVGLLAPLVFAVQRDEADGVGAAVFAVLSGITILAGIVLLRGSYDDEPRDD